jgi:hypothetical protein
MGGILKTDITLHNDILKMQFPQNFNNSGDKLDLKNIMPMKKMSFGQNDG